MINFKNNIIIDTLLFFAIFLIVSAISFASVDRAFSQGEWGPSSVSNDNWCGSTAGFGYGTSPASGSCAPINSTYSYSQPRGFPITCGGGEFFPIEQHTIYSQTCNAVSIDCSGSWSGYSSCTPKPGETCGDGNGTQTRTYIVSVPASGGGDACDYSHGDTQSIDCDLSSCTAPAPEPEPEPEPDPGPTPSCGGYWYNYGSCSASCGGGIQQLRFQVTSGGAACSRSPIYVSCNTNSCPNVAPEVDAGPPLSVVRPANSVNVTDASATDSDGSIESLNWSYVSGPATYNIINDNIENPNIESLTEEGNYVFRFSATDNDGESNSDDLSVTVTSPPDLGVTSPSINEQNPNRTTGEYGVVDMRLAIKNLAPAGGPVVEAESDINYRVTINIDSNRITYPNSLSSAIGSFDGEILADSQSNPPLVVSLNNVPFGTHEFCSRANLDPENYPELDTNNNEECTEYTLPAPRPAMEISVEDDIVAPGDSTVVNWSTNTNYELSCTVTGSGISKTFVTSTNYSAFDSTPAINNATQYTLNCTATETGESFTDTTTVEVIPRIEEI